MASGGRSAVAACQRRATVQDDGRCRHGQCPIAAWRRRTTDDVGGRRPVLFARCRPHRHIRPEKSRARGDHQESKRALTDVPAHAPEFIPGLEDQVFQGVASPRARRGNRDKSQRHPTRDFKNRNLSPGSPTSAALVFTGSLRTFGEPRFRARSKVAR